MEKEDIRQRIVDEIVKTENKIAVYSEMVTPVAPDDAIGRISRMDAIINNSVTEASLRQAESKLNGLKRVLSMYGTPDFGRCIKCKAEISLGRILIMPESLYCINCAR